MESSGGRAIDAASGVPAALNIRYGNVLYGTVALNDARDALWLGGHVWVLVRLVKSVVLATNGSVVDIAMGSNSGSEREGRCNVLHAEWLGKCTSRRSE